MNLLIINNYFSSKHLAGAEWSIIHIAQAMQKNGHFVCILTSNPHEEAIFGIRVLHAPHNKLSEIQKHLLGTSWDIFQVHNIAGGFGYKILPVLRSTSPSTRIVLTFHDYCSFCKGGFRCWRLFRNFRMPFFPACNLCQKRLGLYKSARNNLMLINKYADFCYYVSHALSNFFLANGVKAPGTIAYNGYASLNLKRQFANSRISIVMGGRMNPRKGYHKVIHSLYKYRATLPDYHLSIYGESNGYWEELQQLVLRYNIPEKVTFLGWLNQKQLADLYSKSKIGIIPSLYPDPLPRSAYDMISHGCLVLGSNLGGLPELILKLNASFIFNPFSLKDISSKLAMVCKLDFSYESLVWQEALRTYNLSAAANAYMRICRYAKL